MSSFFVPSPKSPEETIYEWLKRQPKKIVDEIVRRIKEVQ